MPGRGGVVRVAGYRPGGGPRNGLTVAARGGYEYRGMKGWYPEQGRHLDPGAVLPKAPTAASIAAGARGAAASRTAREKRLAAFAALEADGVRDEEIMRLLRMKQSTLYDYRRELRDRAAQDGGGS